MENKLSAIIILVLKVLTIALCDSDSDSGIDESVLRLSLPSVNLENKTNGEGAYGGMGVYVLVPIDCVSPLDPAFCYEPTIIVIQQLRYAYNATSKQCVEFWQGTCVNASNHNNYLTKEDCEKYCLPKLRSGASAESHSTSDEQEKPLRESHAFRFAKHLSHKRTSKITSLENFTNILETFDFNDDGGDDDNDRISKHNIKSKNKQKKNYKQRKILISGKNSNATNLKHSFNKYSVPNRKDVSHTKKRIPMSLVWLLPEYHSLLSGYYPPEDDWMKDDKLDPQDQQKDRWEQPSNEKENRYLLNNEKFVRQQEFQIMPLDNLKQSLIAYSVNEKERNLIELQDAKKILKTILKEPVKKEIAKNSIDILKLRSHPNVDVQMHKENENSFVGYPQKSNVRLFIKMTGDTQWPKTTHSKVKNKNKKLIIKKDNIKKVYKLGDIVVLQ